MSPSRFDSHEDRVDNRAALRRSVGDTKLFSSRGKVVDIQNHSPPWKKFRLHSFVSLISYPIFRHRLSQYHTACFPNYLAMRFCIVQPHFPSLLRWCYNSSISLAVFVLLQQGAALIRIFSIGALM